MSTRDDHSIAPTGAYALDNASPEAATRFPALADAFDAGTQRHLTALGLGAGWHCLEVGGGGGSIARWLAERVGRLPGLALRRPNDDRGDAGICLIAFAESSALATEAVSALRAEGVEAMRVYDPTVVDLHVYPYWKPVLDAIADAGRPPPECLQTLALLERSIHVDLSPLNDEQDLDEIAFAFEKVAHGVLGAA